MPSRAAASRLAGLAAGGGGCQWRPAGHCIVTGKKVVKFDQLI